MSQEKVIDALSDMYSLLDNLRNHQELKVIGPTVGVDERLLTHGDTLYTNLQRADEQQARLQGQYKTALKNLTLKRRSTRKSYMLHRKIANLRIINTNVRRLLQIDEERKTTISDQLEEMRQFYGVALSNAECRATLIEASIVQTELEAGRDAVLAIDTLITQRVTLNTSRKDATKLVNAALRQANSWMRGTRTLMEPEVADKPHLKELLGITIRKERNKEKAGREADE